MSLDKLRSKVAFHNSIDVWIAACEEKGAKWRDAEGYKKFVKHLEDSGLTLQKYQLCVSDADSTDEAERDKESFATELKDAGSPAYTIRLSDSALETIRASA
ncbi:conserved hypothetical protein [Cenarchaeum symbiosum A]|uniref:Uncharacterized protein n=1 Tax=Cenarchaeum symbiosum (strain A) TaxID=414004 RepID=A0RX62_CENSY|nr:conserved hypothetical protein [Cenarchaeum symbiosum A]